MQTAIIWETDACAGEVVCQYQTDTRGDTDVALKRGLTFLLENRLLTQAAP